MGSNWYIKCQKITRFSQFPSTYFRWHENNRHNQAADVLKDTSTLKNSDLITRAHSHRSIVLFPSRWLLEAICNKQHIPLVWKKNSSDYRLIASWNITLNVWRALKRTQDDWSTLVLGFRVCPLLFSSSLSLSHFLFISSRTTVTASKMFVVWWSFIYSMCWYRSPLLAFICSLFLESGETIAFNIAGTALAQCLSMHYLLPPIGPYFASEILPGQHAATIQHMIKLSTIKYHISLSTWCPSGKIIYLSHFFVSIFRLKYHTQSILKLCSIA